MIFPISKVVKLSKSEFKKAIEKLKLKKPAYVAIVETPNVDTQYAKPPSEPVQVIK